MRLVNGSEAAITVQRNCSAVGTTAPWQSCNLIRRICPGVSARPLCPAIVYRSACPFPLKLRSFTLIVEPDGTPENVPDGNVVAFPGRSTCPSG